MGFETYVTNGPRRANRAGYTRASNAGRPPYVRFAEPPGPFAPSVISDSDMVRKTLTKGRLSLIHSAYRKSGARIRPTGRDGYAADRQGRRYTNADLQDAIVIVADTTGEPDVGHNPPTRWTAYMPVRGRWVAAATSTRSPSDAAKKALADYKENKKMAKKKTSKKKSSKKKSSKRKATKRKASKKKSTKRKATKRKASKKKSTKRKATKRKATKRKATKRKASKKATKRKYKRGAKACKGKRAPTAKARAGRALRRGKSSGGRGVAAARWCRNFNNLDLDDSELD